MKSKKTLPILLIIGLLVVAIQCGDTEQVDTPKKVIPVTVADVHSEHVSIPIYGSGMLYAKKQIRLSFKTGGIIQTLAVKEGQNVKKGQVLAQLDLDEIQAQVQQAQSAFEKAQRDLERIDNLFADSVVTLEQKQNVTTQLQVAESNLRIAKFNLEYSTIKAPSDGRIFKRFVEENELVGPGTPVFYFGSGREEWLIRVGVADRDIINVQLGDPAVVNFDAYPGIEFPASVTGVAQAADPRTGTFEIEIQLDARGRRLSAGFVGSVSISPQKSERYTLIPVSALVDARGADAAVYTVVKTKAEKKSVTIGAMVDDRVIIQSGLEGVDKIITAGAAYVRSGDTVQVQ